MKVYISSNALSGNFHLGDILKIYHQNKINQIELSSSNHQEKQPLKIIKIYQQIYLLFVDQVFLLWLLLMRRLQMLSYLFY